jgi:hypothetical protein
MSDIKRFIFVAKYEWFNTKLIIIESKSIVIIALIIVTKLILIIIVITVITRKLGLTGSIIIKLIIRKIIKS